MTTRTIRETDITFEKYRTQTGSVHYAETRTHYRLMTPAGQCAYADTYAEALQTRADIIDERAGAPRVGDMVRIGLKGQVTYRVTSVGDDGTVLLLSRDAAGHHRFRRVDTDRLHVVEAKR